MWILGCPFKKCLMGVKMLEYFQKMAHYQKQYVVNVAVPSFPFFFSQKPTQPKPEPKAKKPAKVRDTGPD